MKKPILLAALFGVVGFTAQPVFAEAPSFKYGDDATRPAAVSQELKQPPVYEAKEGLLEIELKAIETPGLGGIYRMYIDPDTNAPIVPGPTIKAAPGDLVRLKLVNDLPPERDHMTTVHDINEPHGFSHTNMHTHGLWVSPAGNSDNVLIDLPPGNTFDYEYAIPSDHWAGTMWYHPHKHGSTSTQVATGLAGALILSGGLDEVPELKGKQDIVMVLQKLAPMDAIQGLSSADLTTGAYPLESKAQTSINGQDRPYITAAPGELIRLRFIAATTGGMIKVSLPVMREGRPTPTFRIPMGVLAYDGIAATTGDDPDGSPVKEFDEIILAPGNRVDVQVRMPATAGPETELAIYENGTAANPEVIGYIRIRGDAKDDPKLQRISNDFLPADHQIRPGDVATRNKDLLFSMVEQPPASTGQPRTTFEFTIDNKLFEPGVVDQLVTLNSMEQWTLGNNSRSFHPYHIHVNPFRVIATNYAKDDDFNAYLKARMNHYMDTVAVPQIENGIVSEVTVASWFRRYIGDYVLHCHILGHEDRGMMQLVRVVE